jgi:hypothetical protein
MAREPGSEKPEIFTQKDLDELRHHLAHLSIDAVRRYYERAHEECRMIYDRLPSPKHADGGAGVEVAVSTPDLYRSYSLQNHTPVVSLTVSEVRVFVN